MVASILTDINRAFPQLTPEVVWRERTRAQMRLYYEAARRQKNEESAQHAVVARMAVATAIVNTIAGKDVPEFDTMVERLMRQEEEPVPVAAPVDIPGFAANVTTLEGFTEF